MVNAEVRAQQIAEMTEVLDFLRRQTKAVRDFGEDYRSAPHPVNGPFPCGIRLYTFQRSTSGKCPFCSKEGITEYYQIWLRASSQSCFVDVDILASCDEHTSTPLGAHREVDATHLVDLRGFSPGVLLRGFTRHLKCHAEGLYATVKRCRLAAAAAFYSFPDLVESKDVI